MNRTFFASPGVVLLCLSFLTLGACGGGGSDSGSSNTTTIASYNFDNGNLDGWTATGLWHLSTVRASTGTGSARYADPATGTFETFDINANSTANSGTLTSPSINLGSNPTLSFDYFLDNECNNDSSSVLCFFDSLTVRVSTDGGSTFNFVSRTPAYFVGLKHFDVDLYDYANQSVIIQFLFDTDDEVANNFEGAYVDNIAVLNHPSLPDISFYVPVEGTENNSINIPLHFTFPYMGANYTDMYINPNGFLTFATAYTTAPTNQTNILNSGKPSIVAYGVDFTPESLNSGGIYYRRTSNTSIVVDFDNLRTSNTTELNSFSVTLRSNGSFTFNYGTLDTLTAVVGNGDGVTAVDPGETDLSAAVGLTASTTHYEVFTGAGDDSDLANSSLNFAP